MSRRRRAYPLALLVAFGLMLVLSVTTARGSYTDPSSGGQAACTWYNQGSLYLPTGPAWGWSWYANVYGYRYAHHTCYTHNGIPAWVVLSFA